MLKHVRHLIMVSLDAVDTADVGKLLEMPNFSRLASQGTLFRDVESVLVSNTYPAHSSIITGVLPCRHGLCENLRTQPGSNHPDWRVSAADIKAPTLYGRAKEAGLSACSVFYPVTCGAPIRWNLPEVPGHMNVFRRASLMLGGGSAGFVLSAVPKALPLLSHLGEPELDDFLLSVAISAVRRHRPNLLLLHLIDVDSHKHEFGPGSPEALDALRRQDRRIGRLRQAVRQVYPPKETAYLFLSDHGCLPVRQVVEPNRWLAARGFIGGGRYDAFFHNAGGTSFLKICNKALSRRVTQELSSLLGFPGVGRFLTPQEMEQSGMSGEFVCGIEAAEGYAFGKKERGQHGFALGHEGYRPFYLAEGSNIPQGRAETGGCITDICPLAADLLGLAPWEMDGIDRVAPLAGETAALF